MILNQLEHIIDKQHVLSCEQEMAPYLVDWRQRYRGHALAVVRPASTTEVSAVVKFCIEKKISIVPQGGNTSLCGGATPDHSGKQLILSLGRLNHIRSIDTTNQTITVEAGCILQDVQEAAAKANRYFPVSLGAQGSCTIGGNLSTNAGGTAVLRYGSMREQCLGLEVVTAQGEIWHGLRGLRKDNTGYDLRDLFIGAEGTLGIITAAVLKLSAKPTAVVTALIGLDDIPAVLALLTFMQEHAGPMLSAFELISNDCLHLVTAQYPQFTYPFSKKHAQAVLLELSGQDSEEHIRQTLESLLTVADQKNIVREVLVAQSLAQSMQFWHLREHIPLAQAQMGKNIKHDISLPRSHLESFFKNAERALIATYPDCRIFSFGHLGDGNIHYNVAPPIGVTDTAFLLEEAAINQIVYQCVSDCGGSVSAEHGIGQLKRELLAQHKSPIELALMRRIKQALDPLNIMNPGKVL